MTRRVLAALTLVVLTAGCASASHPAAQRAAASNEVDGIRIVPPTAPSAVPVIPAPTVCPPTLRAISSRAVGTGGVTVSRRRSTYLLRCTYDAARVTPGRCTRAAIEINTAPQAFRAFQRWTVETGQNAMWSKRQALNPLPVSGIGIEAEWAPAISTFEAATMNTWVSVFLRCPTHSSPVRRLGMALGKVGLAATS